MKVHLVTVCAVNGPKRFYAEVIVTVFKTSRVAKRDDFHSKLLFFVKNKGQWNAKSGPKVVDSVPVNGDVT